MKKLLIAVVLLSTWIVTFFIAAGQPSWNLASTDANGYTTLIQQLRNTLKGTQTCFDLPMMAAPPNPESYVLMKLTFSTDNIIVALRKSNAYVVGYADTFSGKSRAFLLNDSPSNAKEKAFPDANKAKQVIGLNYGGLYSELEKNGGPRKSLSLTRGTLLSRATRIFGKPTTDTNFKKDQAQFLILAVEMFAEAVRFKYIEDNVKLNLNEGSFEPDTTFLTIVNQWGAISKAVANADQNGKFDATLKIGNEEETKVDDVRKYIALLLYVKDPKCKAKTQSLTSVMHA